MTMLVATALDPRFKDLNIVKTDTQRDLVFRELASQLDVHVSLSQTLDSPSINQVSAISSFFKARASPSINQENEDEIARYRALPTLILDGDPLHWWSINAHLLPRLSQLARRTFCYPATSVPSERLFSDAGNLLTNKRTRLKPENVDAVLFSRSCVDMFDPFENLN